MNDGACAMSRYVTLERRGAVGILTVENGPMNVICSQLIVELAQLCDRIEEDKDIRAVVVTGKGEKAFIAGADILEFSELIALPEKELEEYFLGNHRRFCKLAELSRPTIAAVNGYALGGGCEVALMCDLRIAEEQARFGLPETGLGLIPGYGGTQRLARLVGAARAKELVFTAKPIGAEEALKIGLVNRVVSRGKALEAAVALAEELARQSALALTLAKKAVDGGMALPLKTGLEHEAGLELQAFRSEDIREGISAFLEKRKPRF